MHKSYFEFGGVLWILVTRYPKMHFVSGRKSQYSAWYRKCSEDLSSWRTGGKKLCAFQHQISLKLLKQKSLALGWGVCNSLYAHLQSRSSKYWSRQLPRFISFYQDTTVSASWNFWGMMTLIIYDCVPNVLMDKVHLPVKGHHTVIGIVHITPAALNVLS